jgi:hypothetical protein
VLGLAAEVDAQSEFAAIKPIVRLLEEFCLRWKRWGQKAQSASVRSSVSQLAKLIAALRNNPRDVRFDDACYIAEAIGFVYKGARGSHRTFARAGEPVQLNIQNRRGKIATYQARQLLAMVEKYYAD